VIFCICGSLHLHGPSASVELFVSHWFCYAAVVCCCLAVDWRCNENNTWDVCRKAEANESFHWTQRSDNSSQFLLYHYLFIYLWFSFPVANATCKQNHLSGHFLCSLSLFVAILTCLRPCFAIMSLFGVTYWNTSMFQLFIAFDIFTTLSM